MAILIPLPFAAALEQEENAKILEKAGSCQILRQDNVSQENLLTVIEQSLDNLSLLKNQALKFQKTLPKEADVKLSSYVLSYT